MRLKQVLTNEGIRHIEDVAVDTFIDALRNFDQYEISEKVDGSNIQFGLDTHGFYTSREEFGGKRVYEEADYPMSFATTFQRSAHAALEKVLPIMMRQGGLREGDRIDCEVLYGALPNAIRYTNETNRIILLRVVEGNADIGQLRTALDGQTVAVSLNVPYTTDGKTIETAEETNLWSFEQTPSVSGDSVSQTDAMAKITGLLDKLDTYLRQPSGIAQFSNAEILALPLNKRPSNVAVHDWRTLKILVKDKKLEIQNVVYREDKETGERIGFKAEIKDVLLNELVRKIKSAFGPEIEDGGWIEGVVFTHKDSGDMFKVVDKDIFMGIKEFLWKARHDISDNPKSVNTIVSFLGELMAGLSSSIGMPELGTMQAKRVLRKRGSNREEILNNVASEFDFNTIKPYWGNFLEQKKGELEQRLKEYQAQQSDYKTDIDFGDGGKREFYYDEEINKRTLEVYAELFKRIETMQMAVEDADSEQDLVMALVGKQLGEL